MAGVAFEVVDKVVPSQLKVSDAYSTLIEISAIDEQVPEHPNAKKFPFIPV